MAKAKDMVFEYNPVKDEGSGISNERVVWSTNALNKAKEAVGQGLKLKSNPFMGSVTELLKPDLVRKYTEEEIEDIKKCMKDPVYFAEKCYLMTPEGLQKVKLRDYQIDYLHHLQNNRFSIFLSCRQSGKSTTTAIFCLWKALFNSDLNALILSKSGPAGQDLVSKIKDMYIFLPYHLKIGIHKWNQSSISFDNKSQIATESFSPTAGLGKTINFLILDEFAWCPPNDIDLFYNNIIPTVTTITNSNVCIMSTQNGHNLFYKIYTAAINKKNKYAPFKVDWHQVPQYDTKNHVWFKRDEKWKEEMIGVLGSEEAFYYQYGTQFLSSDKCIVSRELMSKLHSNEIRFINRTEDLQFYLLRRDCFFIHPNYDLNRLYHDYYVILIDLAEGCKGDSTVFHILRVNELGQFEQVAYWKCNELDLEKSALEFWLLYATLFNNERTIISIEWNTYGALFYQYLINLNEPDYMEEASYRFNLTTDIDLSQVVMYKKTNIEDDVYGVAKNKKYVPGIKWNGSNKKTACSLLKLLFENNSILITDIYTITEIENFEDRTGNGTYKASYGHDDVVMTLVQIPMLKQTSKFKNLLEDIINNQHKY